MNEFKGRGILTNDAKITKGEYGARIGFSIKTTESYEDYKGVMSFKYAYVPCVYFSKKDISTFFNLKKDSTVEVMGYVNCRKSKKDGRFHTNVNVTKFTILETPPSIAEENKDDGIPF